MQISMQLLIQGNANFVKAKWWCCVDEAASREVRVCLLLLWQPRQAVHLDVFRKDYNPFLRPPTRQRSFLLQFCTRLRQRFDHAIWIGDNPLKTRWTTGIIAASIPWRPPRQRLYLLTATAGSQDILHNDQSCGATLHCQL